MNVNLKLVGSNCNMRCTYCYEHDTPTWAEKWLAPAEVSAFIRTVPANEELRFLLHGGEPLLYPKQEMARLLDVIAAEGGDRAKIFIQTNGTLIDDEWIDLFRRHDPDFVFSLSIDSLQHNGHRQLGRANLENLLTKKLELLRSRGATVGVVSVISRKNEASFLPFMEQLADLGVRFLTLSKLRGNRHAQIESNTSLLSEREFVSFLERVLHHWIGTRLYERLQVQPFMTLLSPVANQLCTFLDSHSKCDAFVSLYPGGVQTGCDHRNSGSSTRLPACDSCAIVSWCGGGCFGEEKDETYCGARQHLKALIDEIRI
jgi:uncharacterized protein